MPEIIFKLFLLTFSSHKFANLILDVWFIIFSGSFSILLV